MRLCRVGLLLAVAVSLTGCMQSLEEQTKKDPNNIMHKTTQDVGQFDPNAGAKVSDSKIHATDLVTAPVSAYGPMVEQIEKTYVQHALNIFNANEGRYPNSHEEFMTRIIKENKIELPVLPGGKQYQYDVENHKLVVVDPPAPAAP